MSARRGAGYCVWKLCSAYAQPFFLLEAPETFECPVCLRPGLVESERASREGTDPLYCEVRVDFDFDPLRGVYRKRALTIDGRVLGRRSCFTLQSPLIHTRERAVRVGRLMMRNLNRRFERKQVRQAPRPQSREQLIDEGWSVLA
jgi:hypothetical protein